MNKDEQSLLELLDLEAKALSATKKEEIEQIEPPLAPAEEAVAEIPAEKPAPIEEEIPAEEEVPTMEEIPAEEIPTEKEAPAEETPTEEEVSAKEVPGEEEPFVEEVREKKKNIKFLILYMVVFVIVISGLIGGSYLVSQRIHQEMGANELADHSHESTLKNIQNQNKELKENNAELEAKNAELTAQINNNEELLASIGDMVEHDQYLAAAQNAYIKEDTELAAALCRAIDRNKLSIPNRAYFDQLKEKLEL